MTIRQRAGLLLHGWALKLAPEIAIWVELQTHLRVSAAIEAYDSEMRRQLTYQQRAAPAARNN